MMKITSSNSEYCFLDIDFDNYREKVATAAAFVDATDSRYGFSSNDLRHLGGSEISRIEDLIATDHEWSTKNTECGGIQVRPPRQGHRIILKLYWDMAPLACENFATLCNNGANTIMPTFPIQCNGSSNTGKQGKAKPAPIGTCGKALTYRDSMIHRVIPGFIVQGGDFVFGNGSGGESIYNGKKFKDEKNGLTSKHNRRGILSMGNSGKNSNTSQFFITFDNVQQQCDGKHVVFGEVVSGYEILQVCENYGTKDGEPQVPIKIIDCGLYQPFYTPACGYWYDQPDPDSYSGISSMFMVRPRLGIVAPTDNVFQKFQKVVGTNAIATPLIVNIDDQSQLKLKIETLISTFAIDVIIIAPVCSKTVSDCSIELPKVWIDQMKFVNGSSNNITIHQVLIEAKPIEVMSKLKTNSWLSKNVVPSINSWQMEYDIVAN